MASKKDEKKVLRFGFIIYDAVDQKINKKTPKIINSITSISLVKALEVTVGQHIGCFCFHCQLHDMIFQILIERNDTYLNVPETLDYKEKDPPFPFYNNIRLKYGYDIDENMIWQFFILICVQ